jgi:hypothetical protein
MLVISFAPEAPPDTTPPETTIDSGPSITTTSTSATFIFSSSEVGSTFECALDGAAFADPTPASYFWTVEAALDCGPAVTVFAEADSWIDENSASNNFGTDAILKVRSQASSDDFRALVRFALPSNLPAGCVVESATLRLYAAAWADSRSLEVLRLADSWSEGTVTWNNQPATIGAAATTASGLGYREWDVASQVQTMYDIDANHGFLIRDASEGGSGSEQQFHSREKGENPPMLVISFAPGS